MRLRPREKGATLVESALVLLAFLTLLIGGCDLGRLLYQQHVLADRVSEAARYGALHPEDEDGVRHMLLQGGFDIGAEHIMVTRYADASGVALLTLVVRDYPIQFLTPGLAGTVRGRPIRVTVPVEVPPATESTATPASPRQSSPSVPPLPPPRA